MQKLHDMIFLGFHGKVIALERDTGEIIWKWEASEYGWQRATSLLLDRDRLIVSVDGCTYCLDALTGLQNWYNPLKGFGYGIPVMVSVSNPSGNALPAHAAQQASGAAHGAGAAGHLAMLAGS